MHEDDSRTRALLSAVSLGLILSLGAVLVFDPASLPAQTLRQSVTFLGILFVATLSFSLYQFLMLRTSAKSIARKMSRDILTYSHELFSTLYRNSSVPFMLIDGRGNVESTNGAAAKLFNVELEALTGFPAFSFFEGESDTQTALIPEYYAQGKIMNDLEVQLVRPDGVLRYVLLTCFSFKDAKGEKKGLITVIDMTKQKMVDKAKTEFVSLASHQLRTPISGMKWNLELFKNGGTENLTEVQSAYLEKIAHGLTRMDILVSDFLSVSKLELGTLMPQRAPVHVKTFLQSIYDEHNPLAIKKQVTIITDIDGTDSEISSDSHLLHMIVSNLVSNAVKYTREGGTVRLTGTLDTQNLTVVVEDTGMGIPKGEEEMIFSKLFRASNAKSEVTDGTGLGLYIVKEAVLVLHGSIDFVSEEGVGTTFTVVLPVSG